MSHSTGGSLREKAFGDRRELRNVLSHFTAREGTLGGRRELRNVLTRPARDTGDVERNSGKNEPFI